MTRRHRFSDLYHERTNYQFIKHTKRWFIISTTLIILSIVLVGVRGLNFGIDFKGGTEWKVQMAHGSAKVSDVRKIIDPYFGDTKVSTLGSNNNTIVACRPTSSKTPRKKSPRPSRRTPGLPRPRCSSRTTAPAATS